MSKSRFSSLDVRKEVADLRSKLLGLRIANIYDLNKKTYLFKCARPDFKTFLLIESGIRFHSTQYSRDKSEVPSVFAMKLRKFIRTKRIESIEQFGMDRVVDFTFGMGDGRCHLIIEFYAAGNIVLTDKDYKIVSLLRSYELADGTNVSVGVKYPTAAKQALEEISSDQLQTIITAGDKKKPLKNTLSMKLPYGTEFVEHCLLEAGIDPRVKIPAFDMAQLPALHAQFQKAYAFLKSDSPSKGYIVSEKVDLKKEELEKNKKPQEAPEKDESESSGNLRMQLSEDGTRYSDFLPMLFKQFETKKAEGLVKEFNDFDTAVDEYFSKIYAQKVEIEKVEHERTLDSTLAKVKRDQDQRVQSLVNAEKKMERHALLIEQNIDMVDKCILAVNVSLAQQVDWIKLAEHIKTEANNGDPLAGMIHKLKLNENKVTLLLFDTFLVDEDDLTKPSETVDVDLSLTAFANAKNYYADKKKASEKREKTVAQAERALESAEKKAEQKMKETKVKQSVKLLRKPYWFEKFYFFISTDNYIVVAGRDAQQNELLYRRYLQTPDLYFHADLHGASSVICKNPTGGEVPPFTLAQAGTFALCHSGAWKNKVLTSAYYVNANQVSKTAPTGEYLNTGGFMIRGKKNMLSPSQLVMGLALMFRLADESLPNHIDVLNLLLRDDEQERKPKLLGGEGRKDEEEMEAKSEKGEAQPKVWQPKKKSDSSSSSSKAGEADEGDLDEELRNSGFSVKLVRAEPELTASGKSVSVQSANPEPGGSKLPESSNQKESTKSPNSSKKAGAQKKKLSVHERKLLKKQQQQKSNPFEALDGSGTASDEDEKNAPTTDEPNMDSSVESDGNDDESDDDTDVKVKSPGHQPVQYKRGQKAKMKKMKEKYAWQDETDRKVHMKLLGHKVDDNDDEGSDEEEDAAVQENDQSRPKVNEQKKDSEVILTEEQKKELRKQREGKKKQQEQEEEEIRNLMKDEKFDMLTDDQKAKMDEMTAQMSGVNLSALTGKPLAGDILLYALPVCGPYDALKDYKYKVKLVPGGDKKGKVAKSITNVFLNHPDATNQEKDLIKAIQEQEILVSLISDAKLQLPGAAGGGGARGKAKKK